MIVLSRLESCNGDHDLMRTRLISSAPQRFILERRRKRVLLSMLAQMQYGDSLDTIVSTSKWPKSALSLAS